MKNSSSITYKLYIPSQKQKKTEKKTFDQSKDRPICDLLLFNRALTFSLKY